MENVLNIADIKAHYPDEWVLLGNPVMDESRIDITDGTVIYHSKNKKEVCYMGRDKTKGFEKITLIYTGKFSARRKLMNITSYINR